MLEQIYTDFTTKLLPQIQQGLSITKDYFTDLFGRYAHFLFIQDLILTGVFFILLLIGVFMLYKGIKIGKDNYWDNGVEIPLIMFGIAFIIAFSIMTITSAMNVLKDKYIPEVRVYEKITQMISNKN